MANVLLGGNVINNISGVELRNADSPDNYVRFFSANYTAGDGISLANDVISILKPAGVSAGDVMTLISSGGSLRTSWQSGYTPLLTADIETIINSLS